MEEWAVAPGKESVDWDERFECCVVARDGESLRKDGRGTGERREGVSVGEPGNPPVHHGDQRERESGRAGEQEQGNKGETAREQAREREREGESESHQGEKVRREPLAESLRHVGRDPGRRRRAEVHGAL